MEVRSVTLNDVLQFMKAEKLVKIEFTEPTSELFDKVESKAVLTEDSGELFTVITTH